MIKLGMFNSDNAVGLGIATCGEGVVRLSQERQSTLRVPLELAKRCGDGPVTSAEIAEAKAIPARFLDRILRGLKNSGEINSRRRMNGATCWRSRRDRECCNAAELSPLMYPYGCRAFRPFVTYVTRKTGGESWKRVVCELRSLL